MSLALAHYGTIVVALALSHALSSAYAGDDAAPQGADLRCAAGPRLGLPRGTGANYAEARVALGRALFFDTRLSVDGSVSCATCHEPAHAFADGRVLARGVMQRGGTRNTPTLVNAALQREQFWDGRRDSLEAQVFDPLLSPAEHGLARPEEVLARIDAEPGYSSQFQAVFGTAYASRDDVASALASYVRSLTVGDSAFDRYAYGCDAKALSESAVRGLELFRGRAQCVACHTIGAESASFEDGRYHSVGVGLARISSRLSAIATRVVASPQAEIGVLLSTDADAAALGRFVVTRNPADIGKFRTPSLRNVAETAPYMHDGSVSTLEAAVDHELYYRGQALGRPLILTPAEREDLVSFLRALTSSGLGELAAKTIRETTNAP